MVEGLSGEPQMELEVHNEWVEVEGQRKRQHGFRGNRKELGERSHSSVEKSIRSK